MTALSPTELWVLALNWTVPEWQSEISHLTPEQITLIAPAASWEYDHENWQKKLLNALAGLSTPSSLEALGKALTINQIIAILEHTVTMPTLLAKLPPIFVGLPPPIFRGLLATIPQENLSLLKPEALTEAIQHQLTVLAHELSNELIAYQKTLELKNREIETLVLEDVGYTEIDFISHAIKDLFDAGMNIFNLTSRALVIAWNTDRLDIIESLSKIKENCQKHLTTSVGSPKEITPETTNLWVSLEKRLNSVFSDSSHTNEGEILPDHTPAIEALAKFDVWYLSDYWQIGLLPHIHSKNHLELDISENPKAQQTHRDHLFLSVKQNLARLGLHSLGDLKSHSIYSRKALDEFVRHNRHLLHD